MGADILICHRCPVVRTLEDEGDDESGFVNLVNELKMRGRALAVASLSASEGKNAEGIKIVVSRPGGSEIVEMTMDELIERAKKLDGHAGHCEGCPANATSTPFGCYGYVRYPIPEAVEQWLLDRIGEPGSLSGEMFFDCLENLNVDGYDGSAMRADGRIFMADRAPSRKFKTGILRSKTVSADQVWELLFARGPYIPAVAGAILMSFDFVAGGEDEMDEGDEMSGLEINVELPDDDPSFVEIGEYFVRLGVALSSGLPVWVDG